MTLKGRKLDVEERGVGEVLGEAMCLKVQMSVPSPTMGEVEVKRSEEQGLRRPAAKVLSPSALLEERERVLLEHLRLKGLQDELSVCQRARLDLGEEAAKLDRSPSNPAAVLALLGTLKSVLKVALAGDPSVREMEELIGRIRAKVAMGGGEEASAEARDLASSVLERIDRRIAELQEHLEGSIGSRRPELLRSITPFEGLSLHHLDRDRLASLISD